MADSYYEGTGVLVLQQVTPVIKALFTGFQLDPRYPGNQHVYIAMQSFEGLPEWGNIRQSLLTLARELNLTGIDEDDPIEILLARLGEHFLPKRRGVDICATREAFDDVVQTLLKSIDFDDTPGLKDLFVLAHLLDDGHGLESIEFEAGRTCSKLWLGEFGGDGLFISKEVELHSDSGSALLLGRALLAALRNHDTELAAKHLLNDVCGSLNGISCEQQRAQVRAALARLLKEPEPA
jgi:hypothetical protein